MRVLVTGATGFLGRRVVRDLLQRRHEVRCLVHTPGRERLFDHNEVEVHYGNVTDAHSLPPAMEGAESVVHLAAIIREGRGVTFQSLNHQGTATAVAAAQAAGVREFIQLSALGAAPDPAYRYLYSKWQAERAVIESGLNWTVLRPSLLFGEGDEFLNAIAGLVRLGPVTPVLGRGSNRLQPVAADDVARCVGLAVGQREVQGRILQLGGPDQLTYNEIVREVARAMGLRRRLLHLPVWPARLMAGVMGAAMPHPPITAEQLRMLELRNVTDHNRLESDFGFAPRPLRGNIGYVNAVTAADGRRMLLGRPMRRELRDH